MKQNQLKFFVIVLLAFQSLSMVSMNIDQTDISTEVPDLVRFEYLFQPWEEKEFCGETDKTKLGYWYTLYSDSELVKTFCDQWLTGSCKNFNPSINESINRRIFNGIRTVLMTESYSLEDINGFLNYAFHPNLKISLWTTKKIHKNDELTEEKNLGVLFGKRRELLLEVIRSRYQKAKDAQKLEDKSSKIILEQYSTIITPQIKNELNLIYKIAFNVAQISFDDFDRLEKDFDIDNNLILKLALGEKKMGKLLGILESLRKQEEMRKQDIQRLNETTIIPQEQLHPTDNGN